MYRIIILSDMYHMSLSAATLLCMWAVSRVGYISTVNESTGSGTQYVSYNSDPLYV